MTGLRLGIAVFLVPALSSCGIRADEKESKFPANLWAILEKADQIELLSLSPDRPREEPKDAFHGWEVLGKTTLKDADVKKKALAAFKKGVEENKGLVAACFNPRHGIRVMRDGKPVDFVICFECFQVQAFVGDEKQKGFLITESPQATLDAILKEAKVPLPKPKKD